MSDDKKIQSAAKLLSEQSYEEGSETIPKGSKLVSKQAEKADIFLETEDEDIVHNRSINFVKQAKEKHQDKFDYSEFQYVNAKTRSTIICPTHGKFDQTPDKHLNSKHACPRCWNQVRGKTSVRTFSKPCLPCEQFLKRAQSKYGNQYKYDLTNYTGLVGNKIRITCPIHGDFEMIPQNHLVNLLGCPKCGYDSRAKSKTKSYQDFVDKANQVFDNYYKYPVTQTYTNRKSILEIICPIHGAFNKKAQKHLSGQGCFKCKVIELIETGVLTGGYCNRLFREHPELKDIKATLYVLKVGELFKIGITRITATSRIRGLSCKSQIPRKEFTILYEKELTLSSCYRLEQKILKKFRKYRTYTDWSTELLTVDVTPYLKKAV